MNNSTKILVTSMSGFTRGHYLNKELCNRCHCDLSDVIHKDNPYYRLDTINLKCFGTELEPATTI